MSKPDLIKLIEAGNIPSHTDGSDHRLRPEDVLTYKDQSAADRQTAMTELIDEFEDNDLNNPEK